MIQDDRFNNVFTCPICGLYKVHHALHGYQCPNINHWNYGHAAYWNRLEADIRFDVSGNTVTDGQFPAGHEWKG